VSATTTHDVSDVVDTGCRAVSGSLTGTNAHDGRGWCNYSLGELELHHVVLQVADHRDQKLVTFAPTPDDQARIAKLLARRS